MAQKRPDTASKKKTAKKKPQASGAGKKKMKTKRPVASNPANGAKKGGSLSGAAKGAGRRGSDVRRPVASAPSKDDPCGASFKCGACQHIAKPYDQQLRAKGEYVRQLFANAGVVADDAAASESIFAPVLGMDEPYRYRNKVISPFARGKRLADGKRGARYEIKTGMYAAHSHRLVDTDGCLIENEQAKQVVRQIKHLMGKFGIEPYDEDTGVGFMRHVVVRVGHESGEMLVTLVTNGDEFPASRAFCRELVHRCPFITTVVQNVNTRQTNVILGEKENRLYGPGFILDTLCGLSFRISSKSFYQVNSVQTEILYNTAIDLAGLHGTQDVIDAYCGTGTIGLVAASRGARSVVGVDSVESAIRDARENARHNGIENAHFVVGDASAFMREFTAGDRLADEGLSSAGGSAAGTGPAKGETVVFVDPPRAGSTEEFLDSLATLAPQRVVYISCNPETQVRDLAYLQKLGYETTKVVPVDMFPHTNHVETVALVVKGR